MTRKTASERLFEQFCAAHGLHAEPIPTGAAKTADYLLRLAGAAVHVEVKQIDEDDSFHAPDRAGGVSSRTIGDHVRAKIHEARAQLRPASLRGSPCVLLVYNNLDPFQMFGTEEHDFITAMYGEWTVRVSRDTGEIGESCLGRNARLREKHNTSFSAVGHLWRTPEGAAIRLYENVHARHPLNYASLPECIEVRRIDAA